ncbi:MAG: hypothetical protein ACJ8AW_45350 [Rhodopila sp.]
MSQPVLVIGGDSLAHRSFRPLAKLTRPRFGGGAGATVGFANSLIRLFEAEQPRPVLVGRDAPGAPILRQRLFPPYQNGRGNDPEVADQLAILPDLVSAFGSAVAKAPGMRPMISSRPLSQ